MHAAAAAKPCVLACCVIAHSHHAFINNTMQRPMDLGTIRKRLERNGFHSLDSFRAEVQQVWDNAILYNPVEHHVHLAARKFEKMFEERFRALEKELRASLAATVPTLVK